MKKIKFKSKFFTIAFVLLNLFFVNISMAQNKMVKTNPVTSEPNSIRPVEEFKEGKYVVRIIENQDKTFGYQINLNGKEIASVMYKKYISVPFGYKNKENAKIIAKWQVNRINKFNELDSQLSLELAKSLGVTQDDIEMPIKQNK